MKTKLVSLYNERFQDKVAFFKTQIEQNSRFSITIDAWTASNQGAYFGNTA